MGKKRGPAPKPTSLKVLAGNPGKRALNKREPKPALVVLDDLMNPPEFLGELAKEKWLEIVPELHRLKLISVVDVTGLEMACQAYQRWREAEAFLDKFGPVIPIKDQNGKIKYMQQVPQVSIAKQSSDTYRGFMSEFGLSPAARTRITLKPGGEGEDEDDERFFG